MTYKNFRTLTLVGLVSVLATATSTSAERLNPRITHLRRLMAKPPMSVDGLDQLATNAEAVGWTCRLYNPFLGTDEVTKASLTFGESEDGFAELQARIEVKPESDGAKIFPNQERMYEVATMLLPEDETHDVIGHVKGEKNIHRSAPQVDDYYWTFRHFKGDVSTYQYITGELPEQILATIKSDFADFNRRYPERSEKAFFEFDWNWTITRYIYAKVAETIHGQTCMRLDDNRDPSKLYIEKTEDVQLEIVTGEQELRSTVYHGRRGDSPRSKLEHTMPINVWEELNNKFLAETKKKVEALRGPATVCQGLSDLQEGAFRRLVWMGECLKTNLPQ